MRNVGFQKISLLNLYRDHREIVKARNKIEITCFIDINEDRKYCHMSVREKKHNEYNKIQMN